MGWYSGFKGCGGLGRCTVLSPAFRLNILSVSRCEGFSCGIRRLDVVGESCSLRNTAGMHLGSAYCSQYSQCSEKASKMRWVFSRLQHSLPVWISTEGGTNSLDQNAVYVINTSSHAVTISWRLYECMPTNLNHHNIMCDTYQ